MVGMSAAIMPASGFKITSQWSRSLWVSMKFTRLGEPISSSPSIKNLIFTGVLPFFMI